MLNRAEITIKALIVGYDEREFKSKAGKPYHIAEVYYIKERNKDEEKKKFGYSAEAFTYFFGERETAEDCDIKDVLSSLREGKNVECNLKGMYNNYKFNPSGIEVVNGRK